MYQGGLPRFRPAVVAGGLILMKCQECGHENTEGAWLCINCGAKLDREGDAVEDSAETVEEPSRFEPSISENLRRLRDRTVDRQRTGSSKRKPSGRPSQPPLKMPNIAGGGLVLGLPIGVWLVAAFLFFVVAVMLGNLQ